MIDAVQHGQLDTWELQARTEYMFSSPCFIRREVTVEIVFVLYFAEVDFDDAWIGQRNFGNLVKVGLSYQPYF